jgi:predicted membrane protein
MAALAAFVLLAVLVSLAFVLGGVLLPIFLVVAAIVAVVAIAMLVTRRTPAEVTQRVEQQEFLGPGGPDDPTA